MQDFNQKTAFLTKNIWFIIENLKNSNPELQLICHLSSVRSPNYRSLMDGCPVWLSVITAIMSFMIAVIIFPP